MATFLRPLSYKYQWLYNTITRLSTLTVGGETRFRQLALKNLPIDNNPKILDLCCGAGQTTKFLIQYSDQVTGLDLSPEAIARAKANVPAASYVICPAEKMTLPDNSFDIVHCSVAMHEMDTVTLEQIFREIYRVLKPGGTFTFIDLHQPTNPLFIPGLYTFMFLVETETSWQLIRTNLQEKLQGTGFTNLKQELYAGGSLQVIQTQKPKP